MMTSQATLAMDDFQTRAFRTDQNKQRRNGGAAISAAWTLRRSWQSAERPQEETA